MKHFLFTIKLLLLSTLLWSQNSDCNTAISVCTDLYEQNNSPAGTGNVFEQSPFSCQTFGEFNSAWYVFTVQEDGQINFVLEPNNLNDDYDWSLYEITDGGCAGINTGLSPEVSCNSYGETFGQQGSTGISSALGGTGSSNGPGNTAGPPFNADLNVMQGEVYALVVMNYSATLNGYELDFNGSTAEIYDDSPPTVVDVSLNCDHDEITVVLSENILADYLALTNFTLNAGAQTIALNSISFPPGEFTASFTITSSQLAALDGAFELEFLDAPQDLCGNAMNGSIPFDVEALPVASASITSACEGAGGEFQLEISNTSECVNFDVNPLWNASTSCEQLSISDLAPGSYSVEYTLPSTGCFWVEDFEITNTPLPVSLGEDTELCDLQGTFNVTTSATTVQWTGDAALVFSAPNAPTTSIFANLPGTYSVIVTAQQGECSNTDEIQITFNTPPEISINSSALTCFNSCDGSVVVDDESNASITVEIGGVSQTGDVLTFENMCAGEHPIIVTFSPLCSSFYSVTLANPPQVEAQFTMEPNVLTINATELLLTSSSINADSLLWTVEGLEDLTSSDTSWIAEFPAVPGYYSIELVATDANGCTGSITREIQVKDDLYVYIPSAFTPNNDDLNDFFIPVISYLPEYYNLMIYDRWGTIVFSSNDWKKPWLGDTRESGYYAESGVFNWVLQVKGSSLDVLEYKGSVHLLR